MKLLPLLLAAAAALTPATLPGEYDGGQMEVAARLQLTADGHYRYMMSYGALDEYAEGKWIAKDGKVDLTAEMAETNYPNGGKPDRLTLTVDGETLRLDRYDRRLVFRK